MRKENELKSCPVCKKLDKLEYDRPTNKVNCRACIISADYVSWQAFPRQEMSELEQQWLDDKDFILDILETIGSKYELLSGTQIAVDGILGDHRPKAPEWRVGEKFTSGSVHAQIIKNEGDCFGYLMLDTFRANISTLKFESVDEYMNHNWPHAQRANGEG